jgi:amino acid exporter
MIVQAISCISWYQYNRCDRRGEMEQVATYLPGMLLVYTAFVLGMLSPGPNVLAVVGTSMGSGRGPGAALALGISAGSFCWGALTITGLTALLTIYAWLITAIKIFGGMYLLWLAVKAFRSAASRAVLQTQQLSGGGGRFGYFLRGLTIQMTNPKAALTWIAIISLGVHPDAPLWVGLAIVLGTGALSIVGHLAYAFAFSTNTMVAFYGRARRWIEASLGVFFCFAGIKRLTSR